MKADRQSRSFLLDESIDPLFLRFAIRIASYRYSVRNVGNFPHCPPEKFYLPPSRLLSLLEELFPFRGDKLSRVCYYLIENK